MRCFYKNRTGEKNVISDEMKNITKKKITYKTEKRNNVKNNVIKRRKSSQSVSNCRKTFIKKEKNLTISCIYP